MVMMSGDHCHMLLFAIRLRPVSTSVWRVLQSVESLEARNLTQAAGTVLAKASPHRQRVVCDKEAVDENSSFWSGSELPAVSANLRRSRASSKPSRQRACIPCPLHMSVLLRYCRQRAISEVI